MHRIFALVMPLAATTATQASFVTTHLSTDDEFLDLLNGGLIEEVWVAEARMGNNGGSGDRELGINTPTGAPVAQGQRIWTSGASVPFTITYSANSLTFNVDGQVLFTDDFAGAVDQLYIRARAVADSSWLIDNLVIDGMGTTDTSFADGFSAGDVDRDYLVVTFSNGLNAFSMSGNLTTTWAGATPSASNLAAQIKATEGRVPAPGTALVLGACGLAGLRRRR